MHTFRFRCTFLPGLLIALLLIPACESSPTEGDGNSFQLLPVSAFRAYSAGATSIGLQWSASPDTVSDAMAGMRVIVDVASSGTLVHDTSLGKFAVSTVVTGLQEGVPYRFRLYVEGEPSDTSVHTSEPAEIVWAPARRLSELAGGLPIRVYETASSQPSGLILHNPTTGMAGVLSLSNPGPPADTGILDLYLRTETDAVWLRSIHQYTARAIPRITIFSSQIDTVESLDTGLTEPPPSGTYVSTNSAVILSGEQVPASLMTFVRTQDGNYARLLIRRQSNGTVIGGISPNRFIELEISYQYATSVQYARQRR